jgi:hypothetical protein
MNTNLLSDFANNGFKGCYGKLLAEMARGYKIKYGKCYVNQFVKHLRDEAAKENSWHDQEAGNYHYA